ncbi:MAG: hypothetical protein WC856_25485 [Methylococcaceae bacterium]|jgi:hypothetical protein
MSWEVTIEVVECGSPSTHISGAHIISGTLDLGYTDSYGQRIIYDPIDLYEWVILTISKSGTAVCDPTDPDHHPGYITKNYTIHQNMDGTIQTVCLTLAPLPDCNGTGGTDCFIVTATTGSSESVEVNRMRQLRERVSAVSRLGAQLIDVIYGEYKQFSPGIAAELVQDTTAREAVLQIVVRPLFAWYTLAGTLAFDQADQKAIGQAKQDVLNACPQHSGGMTIITLLEAIRAGKELPEYTPQILLDLVPRIAHLRFASWAILDPLIRVWRSITDDLNVTDEVAQWLASAPLEALSLPNDPEILDEELGMLASFFEFNPIVRPQLGERLLTAWPDTAVALEHAGFLSQAPTREKE